MTEKATTTKPAGGTRPARMMRIALVMEVDLLEPQANDPHLDLKVKNRLELLFVGCPSRFTALDITPIGGGLSDDQLRQAVDATNDLPAPVGTLEATKQGDLPVNPFVECRPEPIEPNDITDGRRQVYRVFHWLWSIGVECWLENPALRVPSPSGGVWKLGDAADNWAADYYLDADNVESVTRSVELPVSSENKSNGRVIAVEFCAALIVDSLTYAQERYAGSVERGEHRGFSALHDFCDANMLLPGVESCGAPERIPFYHDVMSAVTRILITLEDSRR